eukprot:scaffold224997_cov14-Prasinocladus_malaysianus.AAC.1
MAGRRLGRAGLWHDAIDCGGLPSNWVDLRNPWHYAYWRAEQPFIWENTRTRTRTESGTRKS